MSKLTLLFFAELRDQLGDDMLTVDYVPSERVSGLIARLVASTDDRFEVLLGENVKVAINAELQHEDALVPDGAELAFFPPVTGG